MARPPHSISSTIPIAAFSWRPAVTDANTTNTVTLESGGQWRAQFKRHSEFLDQGQSTDTARGVVSLVGSGQVTLQVTNSQLGPDYAVLGSCNLLNWSTLFITNSPPTNSFQWTDTNALTLPAQFYRIKIGPPLP